jgi:hypothetical protein
MLRVGGLAIALAAALWLEPATRRSLGTSG